MDDRLDMYGPGPERSWSTKASPSSVNPQTRNTSVARGRALRQRTVWHCLRQMLCRDVALTFATFWGETQASWWVQQRNLSPLTQSSPARGVQCVIQSARSLKSCLFRVPAKHFPLDFFLSKNADCFSPP